ncbi:DUF6972 family protein [Nostoc sp. ChiVER01]
MTLSVFIGYIPVLHLFKCLLYYGEIKINADDQYHVIPRTRPSEE